MAAEAERQPALTLPRGGVFNAPKVTRGILLHCSIPNGAFATHLRGLPGLHLLRLRALDLQALCRLRYPAGGMPCSLAGALKISLQGLPAGNWGLACFGRAGVAPQDVSG